MTVGAWLSTLMPELPLETARMSMSWFRPLEADGSFSLESFPAFQREMDSGRLLWGHGMEGGHAVTLGLHDHGVAAKQIDPDDTDRSVTPDDWADLADMLPAKIPGLVTQPARVALSMMSRTPDGQFVIGRPGGDSRIVVAGGDNGHGFTHASGIGEALADLVQDRPTAVPLGFLSPDRYL